MTSVAPINKFEDELRLRESQANAATAGAGPIFSEDTPIYDPCEVVNYITSSLSYTSNFTYEGRVLGDHTDFTQALLNFYVELCSIKTQGESFLVYVEEAESRYEAEISEQENEEGAPNVLTEEQVARLNSQSQVAFGIDGSISVGSYWPSLGFPGGGERIIKAVWNENRIKLVYDTHANINGLSHPFIFSFERIIEGGIDHAKIKYRALYPAAANRPYWDKAISVVLDSSSSPSSIKLRYATVTYENDASNTVANQSVVTYTFFANNKAAANGYFHTKDSGGTPNAVAVEDRLFMDYSTRADGKLHLSPEYSRTSYSNDNSPTPVIREAPSSTEPAWVSNFSDIDTLFPPLSASSDHAAIKAIVDTRLDYLMNAAWEWQRDSAEIQEVKDFLNANGVPDHSLVFPPQQPGFLNAWDSEGL